MLEITGYNVTHALEEALIKMPIFGVREESRNGPVLTSLAPALITIYRPNERVLVDYRRDANPFLHLAEFVWMLAGSDDVRFLEQFSKRMRDYADPNTHILHGAYGRRWRYHYRRDQLLAVREMLALDKGTRRAVLGMWDPAYDLDLHADLPCNTHIYFRVVSNTLEMTVCNRSNDLIWGCLGANAVHMTYLHELMARSIGVAQGVYRVFTNNLHMYVDRPDFDKMLAAPPLRDCYQGQSRRNPFPVLQSSESMEDLISDSEDYLRDRTGFRTRWMRNVFHPAMISFQDRKPMWQIEAEDWRLACTEWIERRNVASNK